MPDPNRLFQTLVQQAQTAERRYLQGDVRGLDEAIAAWNQILQHPEFATTDEDFRPSSTTVRELIYNVIGREDN